MFWELCWGPGVVAGVLRALLVSWVARWNSWEISWRPEVFAVVLGVLLVFWVSRCGFVDFAVVLGRSLQSWGARCGPRGTAGTETQRLGLLACLATSNFKRSLGMGESLPGAYSSPCPKMRTSLDSTYSEGASLESCCSESSTHGTARTEA